MESLEFTGELRESHQKDEKGFLWEVAVIGEGPGLNYKRGRGGKKCQEYITRESVQGLVDNLEGVKVKAFKFSTKKGKEVRDHLPVDLDVSLSNRAVGNNVGILESPFSKEIDSRLHAFAMLRLGSHDEALWLRDMLVWAHQSGHPDYLGLSINSTGSTRERIEESTGKWYLDIISINRPKSVEVVDTPAAKGAVRAQFVRLVQSYMEKGMESVKNDDTTNSTIEDGTMDSIAKDGTGGTSTINGTTKGSTTNGTIDGLQSATASTNDAHKSIEDISPEVEVGNADVGSEHVQPASVESQAPVEPTEMEYRERVEVASEPSVISEGDKALQNHILSPLRVYLDEKKVVYAGEDVKTIVESLDLTGLSHLDQAAIKQLRGYVRNGQVNAAKHLLEEMIRQLYRVEHALEYLQEYKELGILKQSETGKVIDDVSATLSEGDLIAEAVNTVASGTEVAVAGGKVGHSTEQEHIDQSNSRGMVEHEPQSDQVSVSDTESGGGILEENDADRVALQGRTESSNDNSDAQFIMSKEETREQEMPRVVEENTTLSEEVSEAPVQVTSGKGDTTVVESGEEVIPGKVEDEQKPEKQVIRESTTEIAVNKLVDSLGLFTKTNRSGFPR